MIRDFIRVFISAASRRESEKAFFPVGAKRAVDARAFQEPSLCTIRKRGNAFSV